MDGSAQALDPHCYPRLEGHPVSQTVTAISRSLTSTPSAGGILQNFLPFSVVYPFMNPFSAFFLLLLF